MNIIVQENIDAQLKIAIEELLEFLPKAGVECLITTQAEGRFVSLGLTEYAKKIGFDTTMVASLKDDGFIIKTIDGNYYIFGKTGYGILYGVYTFLEKICNWKVYGVDELQIESAKFIDLDVVDNPTFDFRECVWHAWSKYDPKFSRRLRIHSGYWITPCHSTFEILPPTKYYKEHKDWYSESRCQICFTNEGAFEQYVENSIKVIKEKDFSVKKTPLMMVGQEDANGYCQCENCKADYKKYGGISGVILRFVKKLSKRIDAYMEENFPDVTMKYVAFAYGETTKPPVDENLSPVHESVKAGKTVLFVGTKKQAQDAIKEEAERCGQYYVNSRWLGGCLTNFKTMRSRVERLEKLEAMEANGDFELLPKKEVMLLKKEMGKLQANLGGIKTMKAMPGVMFVVDPHNEDIAIKEAKKLGIKIVAITDTNCDPDEIDYVIPGNDDAIRAIKLISSVMANAVIEANQGEEAVVASMAAAAEKAPESIEEVVANEEA